MKNRNYQILENIKLIENNEIFNRLKEINKVIDFKDKICSIIDLYDNIIELPSTLKAVFLGESGVGKTSFIERYISKTFVDDIESTNGASYYGWKSEFFEEENQLIKFEIWDAGGKKNLRYLAPLLYKDSPVCILVYDITNKNSFDEIRNYWIKEIKEYARKDCSKKRKYIIFVFSSRFGWK